MNGLLLSQNDSFSELSKLTDLGEKNVQEENRERKKKKLLVQRHWVRNKETDGTAGGDWEGKRERMRIMGAESTFTYSFSVVHVWVSSKVYLICSYQAELCNSKADRGWSFGYHPHKGMLFSFLGKNVKPLISFCFV